MTSGPLLRAIDPPRLVSGIWSRTEPLFLASLSLISGSEWQTGEGFMLSAE